MSLYRMCEHEGRFDVAVYRALCDDLSWEEVGRITTAVAVLGDERYDFNEWHKKNHDKISKMIERRRRASETKDRAGEHVVTLDDYRREHAEQTARLAEAEERLRDHRAAVAGGLGTAEGLLDPDQAEFLQEAAGISAAQIDRIEAAIISRYGGEEAKLDDD